jgi:hypothetical protein
LLHVIFCEIRLLASVELKDGEQYMSCRILTVLSKEKKKDEK